MIFSDKDIPDSVRESVRSLARRRRLPQSVMLTGSSEALREKCARELIQAVLCSSDGGEIPCGKCPDCLKARSEHHPDVKRIVPEGKRKTVSIESVRRDVLENLWIAPNDAENKVYVFPNADELSLVVQNALLKSTEEPPDFVMFIFLAERRESLLPTIISRTTEFSLGYATTRSKKSDEAVDSIVSEIVSALCSGNEYDIMLATSPMNKNRKLMKRVAVRINETVRDAMAERCSNAATADVGRDAIRLASAFTDIRLLKIKAAMDKIIEHSDLNANENLLISEFSSLLGEI